MIRRRELLAAAPAALAASTAGYAASLSGPELASKLAAAMAAASLEASSGPLSEAAYPAVDAASAAGAAARSSRRRIIATVSPASLGLPFGYGAVFLEGAGHGPCATEGVLLQSLFRQLKS